MKFLVLGSNSFSGSHFVKELLLQEHQVVGISRSEEPKEVFLAYKWLCKNKKYSTYQEKNFQFKKLDLNKDIKKILDLVDFFKPEYIVNFASQGMVAESWLNPMHWYRTNLLSQVAFHDGIRNKKFLKKYIHISTPEVYGDTKDWIKENHDFKPTTPYSISRAACDMHLLSYHKAYDFPVVFTRAANVYGPGQQLYRIIPRTILSARSSKKLELHGGGYSKRSFIHISDVVAATLELAVNANPGTCWHISNSDAYTIRKLVNKIFTMTGVSFEKIVNEVGERLGKDKNYLLDSSSIRKEFNWYPKVSLEEGLDNTIGWIDDNFAELSNLSWLYKHKI